MAALRPVITATFATTLLVCTAGFASSDNAKFDTTSPAPPVRAQLDTQSQSEPAVAPRRLAQSTSSDATKDDDPYRALTGKVIDAIKNLDKATDPTVTEDPDLGVEAADKLRKAINALVKHADADGKTSDYIAKLVDEAVESSKVYVPIALRGSDGKLDTSLLIQSVVVRSLAPAANDEDADYLAALDDEADSTVTTAAVQVPEKLAQPAAKRERPEFVIVKAGQTLGGIAWKYYGDSLQYVKIYRANRDKIRNPNVVRVGQRLKLP